MNEELYVPFCVLWSVLDTNNQGVFLRKLQNGEFEADGRVLFGIQSDGAPSWAGDGSFEPIADHVWFDYHLNFFSKNEEASAKKAYDVYLDLEGDAKIVDIRVLNTLQLREFFEYEENGIDSKEFDEQLYKANGTKLSSRVWARAAAALIEGEVNLSPAALCKYLYEQEDIWPNGPASEDLLKKAMSSLSKEIRTINEEHQG